MSVPDKADKKSCWVTLVTKPSYLPGVIILAYTLDKNQSKYPLIVQYTSFLGDDAIKALEEEGSKHGRISPHKVELLLPRKDHENTGSVAERFKDTFTKLRAFELFRFGYTRAVFLDADMAIFRNPDEIFESKLPDRNWLGATPVCVCNLDYDSWAPSEWRKHNCAYTPLTKSAQVAARITPESRPTYRLLNGGMFLFFPTAELWDSLLDFFNKTDRLKTYQFPDHDFLADFFCDKWCPLSWKYNALKTIKYWHPKMWSDEDLVILHYIVDKPWERKVSSEGIAGYLGRDGETHQWWWDIYHDWVEQRTSSENDQFVLKTVRGLVNLHQPYTEKMPLSQRPGEPEDVHPYSMRCCGEPSS